MLEFVREHWWIISLFVAASIFTAYRLRHPYPYRPPSNARSFAAIRALRPEELTPYFGTYLPGQGDGVSAVFLLAWITALGAFIPFSLDLSVATVAAVALAIAVLGAFAIIVDFKSQRVIGPDRIAFVTPIRALSWSVPLVSVVQCDLVPGKPHHRLRVHSAQGSFTLPLTRELWSLLAPAA